MNDRFDGIRTFDLTTGSGRTTARPQPASFASSWGGSETAKRGFGEAVIMELFLRAEQWKEAHKAPRPTATDAPEGAA